MALVLADRVRETTTTTGTGSVTLAGAYTGFQTFSSAVGNGNSTYYTIANVGSGEWEVGIGSYASGGNLLSRTTVLASSNGGSLVNFGAGVKDAFVTQPAERALYIASAGTGLESKVTAFTNGGIVYASSTSALTTGSALTFDGTNLGLGGTNNSYGSQTAMTLSGTNVSRIDFRSNSTFTGTILSYQAVTEGLRLQTEAGYPITFYPAGTEAMRIASATGGVGAVGIGYTSLTSVGNNGLAVLGNVGIGTSSPGQKLHVAGAIAATAQASSLTASSAFTDYIVGNNKARFAVVGDATGTAGSIVLSQYSSNGSVGRDAVTIDSSGNTVIGDTTANYRLDVKGSTGNGIAYRDGTVTAYMGTTGSSLMYSGTLTNHPVAFLTNATERARIDIYGNLKQVPVTTASGALITSISASGGTSTVNSATYTVNMSASAKLFYVYLSNGDAALVFTSYLSSSITFIGITPNNIVASASPTASQFGISKSANSHDIVLKTGSALASTAASWVMGSLSSPVA